jgi:hypothetical protein
MRSLWLSLIVICGCSFQARVKIESKPSTPVSIPTFSLA